MPGNGRKRMEVNDISHEYLSEGEEAILVEDGIHIEGIDEVVYVNDIGGIIVPEVYQQWPEGAVALEEISDEGQLELQAYDEPDDAYENQQYEYSQNEAVSAESISMEPHISLEDAVPVQYEDEDLDYAEDELVPGGSSQIDEYEMEADRMANRGRRCVFEFI
ncbi:unnamed protein product [Cylicostephanus goldi]|uniref:Uncharacterized protein n=1 Tax=Cylicostephanus goldi TaxID=71465 RepID=A0A3P7MFX6_CYLGO|nr:unnamed protein product [Cylicostephanus goldi]